MPEYSAVPASQKRLSTGSFFYRHHRTGQWCFGAMFVALPCALAVFSLMQRLPATNYIDAMSRGHYQQARALLQAELEHDNPQAQNALGNLYYLGLGVDKDYRLAASHYHAAAARGFAAAQLNLGHLYRQGLGVRQNTERAFGWYVHANIANSPWAPHYLSQLSSELALSPLQMESLRERWHHLASLSAEPL